MVPNGSAYANYPSFANNGAKTPPGGSPESAKYALGMVPADTFPAEWANWFFHGATAGITRLNTDVGSIKKEINSVLAAYNVTPDATVFNQLYTAIEKRLTTLKNTVDGEIGDSAQSVTQLFRSELSSAINTLSQSITQAYEARVQSLYPAGTIYQNKKDSRSPATLLGFGTWVQITDKFLACRYSSIGAEGGAWNVILNYNNIPRHAHTVGDHTHYMNHVHLFNASHNHDITDNGHEHKIVFDDSAESDGGIPYTNQSSPYGAALILGAETKYYTKVRAYVATTGIAVNQKSVIGYTGAQQSEDETHQDYIRTQGVYGTIYTDWQYAENPSAFDIIPPYIGVYTWYRES